LTRQRRQTDYCALNLVQVIQLSFLVEFPENATRKTLVEARIAIDRWLRSRRRPTVIDRCASERERVPEAGEGLTVGLEGGGRLETGRSHRVLLLVPVLDVADGEADGRQGVAARQWRPDRVLLLQRQPLLGVLVLVDGGDAAFELSDAAIVAEVHVMRHRGQMGVGQTHVVAPHAVGHLVAGLLAAVLAADLLLGRGRGRPGVELGDGVSVVQLRVTGDVVVAGVGLAGVLDRQHVEIGAAVVLRVTGGGTIGLGGGRPGVLEAVRLLELLGRLEHEVDAVGALVVDAAATHRLRKVHYHRPGHSGQVAQVTLRSFAHHLAAEGTAAARSLMTDTTIVVVHSTSFHRSSLHIHRSIIPGAFFLSLSLPRVGPEYLAVLPSLLARHKTTASRRNDLSLSLSLALFSRFFRSDHSATLLRSEDRFRPCKVRASGALLVREITAARNNDDDNVNCLSSRARSVTTARGHMSRERTGPTRGRSDARSDAPILVYASRLRDSIGGPRKGGNTREKKTRALEKSRTIYIPRVYLPLCTVPHAPGKEAEHR